MHLRLFFVLLMLWGTHAQAQYFQLDLMKNRQGNKESSRWTVVDWLSQRQKIQLWDQWLAMNRSANWFEMQVSASEFDYTLKSENGTATTEITDKSQSYSLDLWISLIGLRGEYEIRADDYESRSAMVNLRLIGSSLQSTHFILRGGVQTLENTATQEKWENPFASGSLKLYFLDFIGLFGEYRHFFKSDSNQGRQLVGSRTRAGAFVEYGILQVTGSYWEEPSEITGATGTTQEKRTGTEVGVAFLF